MNIAVPCSSAIAPVFDVAQREHGTAENADPSGLAGRTEFCDDRVDAADEIVAVELIAGHAALACNRSGSRPWT